MKLLLIGSSTGGPNQLKFLLKDVDIKNTCVVIAQHMSASFIPSFVNQFNKEALSEVSLLNDKEVLANKIYICQKKYYFIRKFKSYGKLERSCHKL